MRSNQKAISKLQTEASAITTYWPSVQKDVISKVKSRLADVHPDIYFVIVDCHKDNTWSVFFVFETTESTFPISTKDLFVDTDEMLKGLEAFAKGRVERALKAQSEQQSSLLIEKYSNLDFKKAKGNLNKARLNGNKICIQEIESTLRSMRKKVFEFDDALLSCRANGKNTSLLDTFESLFPLGVYQMKKQLCSHV
jgi:hypothetical protein